MRRSMRIRVWFWRELTPAGESCSGFGRRERLVRLVQNSAKTPSRTRRRSWRVASEAAAQVDAFVFTRRFLGGRPAGSADR
jgi:hypothetical protein